MTTERVQRGSRIIFLVLLLPFILAASAAAVLVGTGELNGFPVLDPGGKPAGKMTDLLIDLRQGRIAYLLISPVDAADRRIAIPWRAARIQPQPPSVRIAVPAAKMRLAPSAATAFGDRQQEQAIHKFFGVAPYWEGDPMPAPPRPPKDLRVLP